MSENERPWRELEFYADIARNVSGQLVRAEAKIQELIAENKRLQANVDIYKHAMTYWSNEALRLRDKS